MKKTVGVVWGRFNPPHRGHVALIERLAKSVDFLIVAVGNAEGRNTRRDPFSGDERVEMMRRYLKERNVRVKGVVAVRDGETYASSVDNLFKKCGKFDVLFTDHKVFAGMVGGRARVVGFRRRGRISSTLLRDSIAAGKEWENLTGRSVVELIKKYDGVERIRRSYRTTE